MNTCLTDDGRHLLIIDTETDERIDADQAWILHAQAAVSEGYCPIHKGHRLKVPEVPVQQFCYWCNSADVGWLWCTECLNLWHQDANGVVWTVGSERSRSTQAAGPTDAWSMRAVRPEPDRSTGLVDRST